MNGAFLLRSSNSCVFMSRNNADLLTYNTLGFAITDYPHKEINLGIMILLKCLFNAEPSVLAVEAEFKKGEQSSPSDYFINSFLGQTYPFVFYPTMYEYKDLADKSITLCYLNRNDSKFIKITLEFFDKSRKKLNSVRLENLLGTPKKYFLTCTILKETNKVFEGYFFHRKKKDKEWNKSPEDDSQQQIEETVNKEKQILEEEAKPQTETISKDKFESRIKEENKQKSFLIQLKQKDIKLPILISIAFAVLLCVLLIVFLIKRFIMQRKNNEEFSLKIEKILQL